MAISDLSCSDHAHLTGTSLRWAGVADDIQTSVEGIRRQLMSLDWRSPAASVAIASATVGLAAARQCSCACRDVATAVREHARRVERTSEGLLRLGSTVGRFL